MLGLSLMHLLLLVQCLETKVTSFSSLQKSCVCILSDQGQPLQRTFCRAARRPSKFISLIFEDLYHNPTLFLQPFSSVHKKLQLFVLRFFAADMIWLKVNRRIRNVDSTAVSLLALFPDSLWPRHICSCSSGV